VTSNQSTDKAVLVAEGNEGEREGMASLLRREGYEVFTAEDGDEALLQLQYGPKVDVILMDMLLPKRDGWGFLQARQRFPELAAIPVVIVTKLGISNPKWAKLLGAAAYYRKPVIATELLKGLRRICADQDYPRE